MKKIAVFLGVILFCSACSLFKAKVIPYPMGVIFPLEKDYELAYEGEIIPPLQREENLVYFVTRKGKIYCIDGQKKEKLWEVDIPTALESPPFLSEDRIYVTGRENTVFCVSRSGKILWKSTVGGNITSGVAESGGQVYTGTEEGFFFALNAETGEEIWQLKARDAIRSNLVFWQDKVLFGSDDHWIYFVDAKGGLAASYYAGGKTGKTLAVEDDLLFFGTDDRYLHCVNLPRHKRRWRIRSGGAAYVPPAVAGKRLFFLSWNCVIYCLDIKSGTILWWNSIPSRSYYRVEVVGEKVVVSSLSPELVCYDIRSGENRGRYKASQEIKSNPVWLSPYLLINLMDPEDNKGKLLFLKKSVEATLTSVPASPAEPNEEITIRANTTGFHLPKYAFFLSQYIVTRIYPGIFFPFQRQDREVVQESSEKNTWDWFADREGFFSVEVDVTDEKERANAELLFLIRKKKTLLSLSSLPASPQEVDQNVVFTADFSGVVNPRFEFRLNRLERVTMIAHFPFLILGDEKIVREESEAKSWAWTPEKEGVYFIRVIAQDGRGSASAFMAFTVKKKE